MATIREKVEDVFAAVAFAERDNKEEAVQLAKSEDAGRARTTQDTRKDKRPRASLRAE